MVGGEPRESLVESVAGGGARRLHVPVAVPHAEQAKLLLHLLRLHRCKGKDQRRRRINFIPDEDIQAPSL